MENVVFFNDLNYIETNWKSLAANISTSLNVENNERKWLMHK